ncbi:DUF6542 domain-containing protein, partial [Modestobacter versicolor]|uniref:DUF6542 domain-containing protein n=1 Tax=Modestobacter versicolor TaxID=429133 RepID=UPI00269ADA46
MFTAACFWSVGFFVGSAGIATDQLWLLYLGYGVIGGIGLGIGMITLIALTLGTAVAALVVRRRDLFSVIVAPPLVFVAVAVVNIGLAPSATLNAPTLATLLVRGFPAMGVATAVAVVISLGRLVAKR